MKRQYLGDAKDAFKWDYLDFLTRELKIQLLNILLMLTPDDDSKQGKSNPRLFPAPTIWPFCEELRKGRDFGLLRGLPKRTGANYAVELHRESECFATLHTKGKRGDYFAGISSARLQVIFLDPDNGFAPPPPSRTKNSHVKCGEVKDILERSHSDSIIVVFQHAKQAGLEGKGRYFYVPFAEHYAEIRKQLPLTDSQSATAIFWCNEVMFVILGESAQIEKVRRINRAYRKLPRPVQTLD